MSGPRFLVLSASTGNGHMSAAHAIAAEAEARGYVSRSVDVLDFTGKGFRGWYRGGYEQLVRRKPKMWGHLYKSSDRPLFNFWFQTGLDWTFCKKLEDLVLGERPDWVVCTHSLPQPWLATFRKRAGFRMGVVVTDLYVHRMWLRGAPDWWFVPQEWSRSVLERRIPGSGSRTSVTGIPVHPVFSVEVSRGAAREEYGLGEGVWALVSSGGIGGGPVGEAVSVLREAGVNCAVVAGRNEEVLRALSSRWSGDAGVRVLGHVSQGEMAGWMRACDFLVSKPGGLTTFEALTVGLPFLVYWPFLIPGQEEGNAMFLEEAGAGRIAREVAELGLVAREWAGDAGLRERMSVAARGKAMPGAAGEIVSQLAAMSGVGLRG